MKITYLICLLAVWLCHTIEASGSCSDTTFIFSYDQSGNRTERIIDLTKSAQTITESDTNEELVIQDNLAGLETEIYPNPTRGELNIIIPQINQEDVWFQVFNNNGKLIFRQQASGANNKVSLSAFPAGLYILKITSGQKFSEWKIIKD